MDYTKIDFTKEQIDALLDLLKDTDAGYTHLGIVKYKLELARGEFDEGHTPGA